MHKIKQQTDSNWKISETDIKVAGKDHYLYPVVHKFGNTVDFLLNKRRVKDS